MSFEQLFDTEERRASMTYKVTIHGILGPEPFTVFNISGGTTAAQLLHQVSLLNLPYIHQNLQYPVAC